METKTNKIGVKIFLNYFLYCFVGTMATIYMKAVGCDAITASSLSGIVLSVFAITRQDEHHFSWAGFSGSFAGMTNLFNLSTNISPLSLDLLIGALVLSLIVSVLFSVSEIASSYKSGLFFDGYGGRLGTIAFISVLIYFTIRYFTGYTNIEIFSGFKMFRNFNPVYLYCIPSAAIAALISMEIKNTVSSLNDNYKVLSVAITGIFGGILVTKIPIYGYELGLAWYAGSFVGMSSYFVLMLKRHYLYAGILTGVLFILTSSVFNGTGGKLGFVSFLAVLLMRWIINILNKLKERASSNPEAIIESLKSGKSIDNNKVDDDYAQKLVESLMKAKEGGDEINNIELGSKVGEFVIGEKYEYTEEADPGLSYLEYMPNVIKDTKDFINALSIDSFSYLQLTGNDYEPVLYSGIDSSSVQMCRFKNDSPFIKTLSAERRIIAFGKKGLEQPVFRQRISSNDLNNTNYLIIVPYFEADILSGFFMIFERNENLEDTKRNIDLIRQFYKETFR